MPLSSASLQHLTLALQGVDEATDQNIDLFTLFGSRRVESRLQALMVPNTAPMEAPLGSGFGLRTDPITGRAALHTGLDFPADIGTPIPAAVSGLVQSMVWQTQNGQLIEIGHGNGLATRQPMSIVRWCSPATPAAPQAPICTSRCWLASVPHNPARFLAGGAQLPTLARSKARRQAAATRSARCGC